MAGRRGGESGLSDIASIRGSVSSVTWVWECVGEITVEVHGLHVHGVSLGTGPRGAISWDRPG